MLRGFSKQFPVNTTKMIFSGVSDIVNREEFLTIVYKINMKRVCIYFIKLIIFIYLLIFLWPLLAFGQEGDSSPQPAAVATGPMQYTNNKWNLFISRELIVDYRNYTRTMSYQIEVNIDLNANPEIVNNSASIVRNVAAHIKGVVSWNDSPINQPHFQCRGYDRSMNYSTTGSFGLLGMVENGVYLNTGFLTIYHDFPFPVDLYTVQCMSEDPSTHRWQIYSSEPRTPGFWMNRYLKIVLQPGNYTQISDLSTGNRRWKIKIEPVGPPIMCLNQCDDNNACTTDKCKIGIGCIHMPLDCSSVNNCVSASCDPAIGCVFNRLTGIYNFNTHDCYKNECQNGYQVDIPDDSEVPVQASPHVPCDKQVCVGGDIQTVANLTEILPQEPHNCRREVCGPYGVEYREDNTDVPLQESSHDCLKQVCQHGEIISVPDDSETPLPSEDGRRCVCQDGEVVVVVE